MLQVSAPFYAISATTHAIQLVNSWWHWFHANIVSLVRTCVSGERTAPHPYVSTRLWSLNPHRLTSADWSSRALVKRGTYPLPPNWRIPGQILRKCSLYYSSWEPRYRSQDEKLKGLSTSSSWDVPFRIMTNNKTEHSVGLSTTYGTCPIPCCMMGVTLLYGVE